MKKSCMYALTAGTLVAGAAFVACGGGSDNKGAAPSTGATDTPKAAATKAAIPTPAPTVVRTATPKATPTPVVGPALEGEVSHCQEEVRTSIDSVFSAYPALQGVREQFLQVTDNLCSRVVPLICEGGSDEQITAAVGDACDKMKSLSEQVGVQYSAVACKDAMTRSFVGNRASVAAGCPP